MATKRPADSDQSCSGSSKLARVQDNPHSSSSDEASASGSNEDWPFVFSGNEVVWHNSAHNWLLDVEEIILGGDLHCSFSMGMNHTVSVGFGTQSQYVDVNDYPLSTTNSNQATFGLRAHLLVDQCYQLHYRRPCHIITQVVRHATTTDADSDDEQVPDPVIPPAFTQEELAVLNDTYCNFLWPCFQKAVSKKFQNAQGKHFFVALGNFLKRVHLPHIQQYYESTCSTNPQGACQPGNLKIIITDTPREFRTSTKKCQRRVADYVMYDARNNMYSIVGEIKSADERVAEYQNVEQMVGLFRKKQKAMLGFTCTPSAFIPRILIHQQRTLELHTLQTLSLAYDNVAQSLRIIAQLFIAFISIVNIA